MAEFEEVFSTATNIDKQDIKQMFTTFDKDKNGLIGFEEFK